MIRRDILLADGARWLLVSQVEHARLSHLLAEQYTPHSGGKASESSGLIHVRHELLEAIRRHDDGWARWEELPGLDPKLHRPLSFRELPLGEALANWDGSIASAAQVGPLAGWVVAGHFAALLENSDEERSKPQAARWLKETARRRANWFAEWQSREPQLHIRELADEALLWLQSFDHLSLWLCSVCPAEGEVTSTMPEPCRIAAGSSLDMLVSADSPGKVIVDPWRFHADLLDLKTTGHVVPVRAYRDAADLLASFVPHELRWTLAPE